MPKQSLSVRAKVLGGTWEVIGADHGRGIYPEGLQADADNWGPSKASFTLRRDGRIPWPDLVVFTPIDIEVGGKVVWSGRITETPNGGSSLSMSIQCEGWQFHLDDDVFEKFWVHQRTGDWKDSRSFPGVDLAGTQPRYNISNDQGGAIVMGCSPNIPWTGGTGPAITLDLGPDNAPKHILMTARRSATVNGNLYVYLRGSDTPDWNVGSYEDYVAALVVSSGITTSDTLCIAGTIASTRRYAVLLLYNGGATYTPAGDEWVAFSDIKTFSDSNTESGGVSHLKAKQVIVDSLALGTSQLSADQSQISGTTTNLTDFYMQGARTPREMINNANIYHNYITKIDAARRMVFGPQPSRPIYEVGSWSGMTVDDMSSNSGSEIYSRVRVEATDPAGQPVRVVRNSPGANYVTRWGFARTKILQIGFTLPADGILAAAIGDAWLTEHYLTPFKGSVKVVEGAVRDIATGKTIPMEDLLAATQQLIRFTDRADPDTGGWSRDGRIAAVSWAPGSDSCTLAIDNTRANFEALLARLAVVVGNIGNSAQ
jgi:hypothetical protein